MLLAVVAGLGCSDRTPPPEERGSGIVSLSPAMTTIVQDLGAGERLVGRTPWCRGVDGLPVVGALDGVDAEMLVGLHPAIVVNQPPASGPDPVLLALRERLGFELIGGRLDGSGDVITAIDALRSAGVGDPQRTEDRRRAMVEVQAAAAEVEVSAPSVLILFSVDPFSTAGAGTYLDEVIRAAGGRNPSTRAGWIELSVEELVGLAPDVVLLVTGSPDSMGAIETVPWGDRPRILILEDPDALEPSTRMPAVVDRVRGLLGEASS
jgi:iron complex transport system substrate-binding protein